MRTIRRVAKAPPREAELTITELTPDGLGSAQLVNEQSGHARAVHVRNALPGEIVQARILKKKKGQLFADGVGISSPSADRQRSACVNFPRCGGCSMHHMVGARQLALKQQDLADALVTHGIDVQGWRAPYSAVRLGYRRKARLGVRKVGEQVLVGFRESFSNRVARLDTCMVLTPTLAALILPLRTLVADLSIADQIPQIELAQGDDQAAIMVRHLAPLTAQDLALWQQFQMRFGVHVLLQSGGYDSLRSLDTESVPTLGYQLPDSGLYMHFYPQQFTQVNSQMNQALIRTVRAYLGDLRGKRVVDLFCGIGNFSLPLARAGAEVWGYEVAADAVNMARHNARTNVVRDTHFEVLDLYGEQARGALPVRADALVLDPPRSGAGPNLSNWLQAFDGAEVVYVSCNPQTFAQDAAAIAAAGFVLQEVGIFDMFPNTAHVETVGYFRRAAVTHG